MSRLTLLRDFLAFPPGILLELFARVLFACACGALIGLERARRFKEAGMRTHCIIAAAAALLMVLSKYCFADLAVADGFFSGDRGADPARIAAQIVSGVGFLGAGVIFRSGATVKGLTTAAGIWATSAVGMAIGSGMYAVGLFTAVVIVLLQFVLHRFHIGADAYVQSEIRMTIPLDDEQLRGQLYRQLEAFGMTVQSADYRKNEDGTMTITASVRMKRVLSMEQVVAFTQENKRIQSFSIVNI